MKAEEYPIALMKLYVCMSVWVGGCVVEIETEERKTLAK